MDKSFNRQLDGDFQAEAELAVIADAEFDYDKPFTQIYYERESGRRLLLPFEVVRLISRKRALTDRSPQELKKAKYRALQKKFDSNYEKLSGQFGKRVMDTILEGRLKLAFLIDSDGGEVCLLDAYKAIAEHVNGNKGQTRSFVTAHALSAGFELMASADDINLLNKSLLLWHFSDDGTNREEIVRPLREPAYEGFARWGELNGLYEFLKRSPHWTEDVYNNYINKIIDLNNPEGEIIFDSGELAALEIAKRVFGSVKAMARSFSHQFEMSELPEIRDFWKFSDQIARENSEFSSYEGVDVEKRRQLLKAEQAERFAQQNSALRL